MKTTNITISGLGYVGCSLAVLLSQEHLNTSVTAVDIIPSKIDAINNHTSPIRDPEISTFLKDRTLNLTATTDTDSYSTADIVIIAVPTNYDPKKQFFDTSAVENVIDEISKRRGDNLPLIVIKSTIPVGYTESFLKSVKKIKSRINERLNVAGILLTMCDARTILCKTITEQVAETFHGQIRIFKSKIPNTVKVGESVYYSEPLIEYAPESNACKAYERLAGEVIAYEG